MKMLISAALAVVFVGCGNDNVVDSDVVKSDISKQAEVKEVQKSTEAKEVEKTPVVESVEKVVEPKVEVADVKNVISEEVATAPKKTGESIFAACIACHGKSAEKKALGKSQIIKGWESSKVTAALKGYQEGTYGGTMKGVMKGQASVLSDSDIKIVSDYISRL